MTDNDYTMIAALVVAVTDKAIRIRRHTPGGHAAPEWVPKSQVRDASIYDVGDDDVMDVATWLAEDREWPEAM